MQNKVQRRKKRQDVTATDEGNRTGVNCFMPCPCPEDKTEKLNHIQLRGFRREHPRQEENTEED